MKHKFLFQLFLVCLAYQNAFSQEIIRSIDIHSLPQKIIDRIKSSSSVILKDDGIEFDETVINDLDDRENYYHIKIKLSNDNISGNYTINVKKLGSSQSFSQIGSGSLKAASVSYCCLDPSHIPRHSARTKGEILEMKRKYHCKDAGFCDIH